MLLRRLQDLKGAGTQINLRTRGKDGKLQVMKLAARGGGNGSVQVSSCGLRQGLP